MNKLPGEIVALIASKTNLMDTLCLALTNKSILTTLDTHRSMLSKFDTNELHKKIVDQEVRSVLKKRLFVYDCHTDIYLGRALEDLCRVMFKIRPRGQVSVDVVTEKKKKVMIVRDGGSRVSVDRPTFEILIYIRETETLEGWIRRIKDETKMCTLEEHGRMGGIITRKRNELAMLETLMKDLNRIAEEVKYTNAPITFMSTCPMEIIRIYKESYYLERPYIYNQDWYLPLTYKQETY